MIARAIVFKGESTGRPSLRHARVARKASYVSRVGAPLGKPVFNASDAWYSQRC